MKTVYIVFFGDHMVFAFNSADEANAYIIECCKRQSYDRSTLYYRSVDFYPED